MRSLRCKVVLLIGLWAAFWCFGLWVRSQMAVPLDAPRFTEIYSFDFQKYAQTFVNCKWITYGRFRHPLWGWLTAPVTVFGQQVIDNFGEQAFWIYLIGFFALVGVGCVSLVYYLIRRCGETTVAEALATTAVFASFAHVWLLSGMPESFGLAMLLALVALWWGVGSDERMRRERFCIGGEVYSGPKIGERVDTAGWCVLAFLMGGITITQGAKAVLAFFYVHRKDWRKGLLVIAGFGAFLCLVLLVFYIRVRIRVANDPSAPGMDEAWESLFKWIAVASMPAGECFKNIWIFFSEPILLRGENFNNQTIRIGYDSFVQPVLVAVLYALVLVSAWWNRNQVIVRLMGVMFLVDVGIHFVLQWGLVEPQLYGGHWFYALPILLGLGFRHLRPKVRPWAVAGLWLLAGAMIACNLHGYFCHDVAFVWQG